MERVIVRLSTVSGWEWTVEPEKEKELLQALNRLGQERPTEALETLAERMEKATEDWAPGKCWERHAEGVERLAVMAKRRGLDLSRDTAIGLSYMYGADWCQELEDIYRPEGLRKLADVMEALIDGRSEPESPETPETLMVARLKRQNKRLRELYSASIRIVRSYQAERESMLGRVHDALNWIRNGPRV